MANVNRPLRSSELARLAGVSTDTLRFYEREGLLAKPPRTSGNYRVYPADALKRIQLVRGGLSLGFSVAELRQLLAVRDRGGIPCLQARKLAKSKLDAIEQDIRDLQALRRVMQKALRSWDEKINAGPVVARLGLLEAFVEANPEATQRRSPLLPRGLWNSAKRGKL